MSKSYKVAKKIINMGEKKGQTLFSVRPYSYGTLTTEEVANQIAVESTVYHHYSVPTILQVVTRICFRKKLFYYRF